MSPEHQPKTSNRVNTDLMHIRIEGELNYSSKSFIAVASLKIKLSQEIKKLSLNASKFSILHIKIDDDLAKYNYDMEMIHIDIPKEYRGKEVWVKINYIVTNPEKGLHFITKDEYGPLVQDQAWTTGEGQTRRFEVEEENKYWFPNVSGPSSKCTSETIIIVPKEQEVISNGDLVKIDDLAKKRRFHWKMGIPHSTYLISIVAGEFDSKEDQFGQVKLMYYVPKGRRNDIDRAFYSTKDLLEFFGNYTGMPYPFSKFAQACVYGAPFGGMENTTANTLTERMLHDERAHLDYNYEENVGHHMAHQWFGDIVTCKTWEDVWLNESFAIFAYAQYLSYKYGQDEYQYYYLEKIDSLTETTNILGGEEVCSKYSEYPDQSFGRYNIEKGSIVLSSLNTILGDVVFRGAIKEYLSQFKYGSASTKDLHNVMEQISDQDLNWFFDEFVYAKGFPDLVVSYHFSKQEKKLSLYFEQKQQIPRAFKLKFRVILNTGPNKSIEESIELNSRAETISVSCNSPPEFICIDPDQSIVGKIIVEEDLQQTLSKIRMDKHLVCRIRAIRRLKTSFWKEVPKVMAEILISKTEHWGISNEAAIVLGSIITEDSFKTLKNHSMHFHPKVRKSIAASLGEFKTKESYDLLNGMLQTEKSYYVIGQILHSMGKTGIMEAIGPLINGLNSKSHGDTIAIGSIRGISELGTEEATRELIRIAQFSLNKKMRLAAIHELSNYLGDPFAKSIILKMIESNDNEIRENSFNVALKYGDPELAMEAKDKFISRYYIEYQMKWVA